MESLSHATGAVDLVSSRLPFMNVPEEEIHAKMRYACLWSLRGVWTTLACKALEGDALERFAVE